MNDITIVVPIFNLENKRFENFKFIIDYIAKLNIPIVIIEQFNDNLKSDTYNYLKQYQNKNIYYHQIQINDDKIHKSKLINIGSSIVNTKYLWMLDADCYLRYQEILPLINDQDVIKPFKYVIVLTESETKELFKFKTLHIKKESRGLIKQFGPLSFIIKKDIFNIIGKMNESFIGYGWEDLEFANRVKAQYSIQQLDLNGLHLYHKKPLERLSNKILYETIIKKQLSKNKSLNITKIISLYKHFPSLKKDINISNLIKDNGININQHLESITKTKIIHAISPALLENKKELYSREMLAIESIINQKKKCNLDITSIIISNNPIAQKFEDNFIVKPSLRTAQDIGDKRDLPYLSDIFKTISDMVDDEAVLFYTNSDCCIGDNTYEKILLYNKHAIEYHRNDVLDNPSNLHEIFNNENTIHKTGIDGLALTKIFYESYKQYIPDFFIGEPHWDTTVGGFLRNFNLSSINTNDLYHPKHDLNWDTKNLTIAGKHNTDIYREYLESGMLKNHILSLPKEYIDIDTNVVIVHFGSDPIRVDSTNTALNWLSMQCLPVEYIFVELVYDNNEGAFEYLKGRKNFKYVKVIGKDSNKILWQKESMMNIGAKACNKNYVIFLDSDVYSKHSDWFEKIRKHLELNNNSMLQVFKLCIDSKFNDQIFVSLAAKWNNYDIDVPHNPGLGIALSRDKLVQNNYFNPYCIYGGGDTCILTEYCNTEGYLFNFEKLHNIKRSLNNKYQLDYIDEDIIHENHGEIVSLNYYKNRHEITKSFTKEIVELVKVDDNSLLSWNDNNCLERKLIEDVYKTKFKG